MKWVFGVVGFGLVVMEMVILNFVWCGMCVLLICNGFFSVWMVEMVMCVGVDVVMFEVVDCVVVSFDEIVDVIVCEWFEIVMIV